MERLRYKPEEIRDALRFSLEQAGALAQANAGNWRRVFQCFREGMTKRSEALLLIGRMLGGHGGTDIAAWYREAAAGNPPPLPASRYGRLAMVYKLVGRAIEKPAPGFMARGEKVDLQYAISNGFEGGSLGERFDRFRQGYLQAFADEWAAFAAEIERRLPAEGEVDLWDLAAAALG